jgi:hypothetical protein
MHKLRAYHFLILTLGLLLINCGSRPTASPPPTITVPLEIDTQPVPTTTTIPMSEIIRIALAQKLGVNPEDVQIHSMDETDWPDNCLGVAAPNEVCSQIITPGYGGIMINKGMPYEFHTDASGKNVRLIPGAALAARQILAAQLGLEDKKVTIINSEAVTWQDNCLEVNLPNQACTPVETPGYRVTLDTPNGKRYQFHTDETGGDIRLAEAPPAQVSPVLIHWSQTTDGVCLEASFGEDLLAFGACGGPKIVVAYASPDLDVEMHHFIDKYMSFEADTPAGTINMVGTGNITTTPVDQRIAAEWARLATLEASSGSSGAAWGLIFAWHRQGGIAGFCDDVTVYLNGIASATSCQGDQPQSVGQTWLTANQMRTIYTWADTYQDYDYTSTDPATVDGMTMRMIFNGNGTEQMNEFEQTRLTALAQEILGELQTTSNPADLEDARKVLVDYLSALTARDYLAATDLFGGSYQILRDNNPDINPEDHASLFQAGCTYNGFVCNLVVKNFVDDNQLSATDFRFTVELQNPDTSLFVLGPCCGADPETEPPWTQFDFLVRKTEAGFLVQDLPVYVP